MQHHIPNLQLSCPIPINYDRFPGVEEWLPFADTEVQIRQMLNALHAVRLACGQSIGWLLHIDADELFFTTSGDANAHFKELTCIGAHAMQYANYEALPELDAQAEVSPFRTVTLFKKNPQLLPDEAEVSGTAHLLSAPPLLVHHPAAAPPCAARSAAKSEADPSPKPDPDPIPSSSSCALCGLWTGTATYGQATSLVAWWKQTRGSYFHFYSNGKAAVRCTPPTFLQPSFLPPSIASSLPSSLPPFLPSFLSSSSRQPSFQYRPAPSCLLQPHLPTHLLFRQRKASFRSRVAARLCSRTRSVLLKPPFSGSEAPAVCEKRLPAVRKKRLPARSCISEPPFSSARCLLGDHSHSQ